MGAQTRAAQRLSRSVEEQITLVLQRQRGVAQKELLALAGGVAPQRKPKTKGSR
jgi:hypothetical protein